MSEPQSLPSAAIRLEALDWFSATWRNLPPLPGQEAEPFDLERGLARLALLTSANEDHWDRARLSPAMSAEEARFWYEAMTQAGPSAPPCALAVRLRQQLVRESGGRFWFSLGRPEILSRLRRNHQSIPPHIVLPLSRMTSPRDVLEIALSSDLDTLPSSGNLAEHPFRAVLRRGIQSFLIPYLSREQLGPLQDFLRERLSEVRFTPMPSHLGSQADLRPVFLLAAAFGLHEEMDAMVSAWPDDKFARATAAHPESRAQWLIFGLGSPDAVRHHLRRLKLRLVDTRQVRAFLAHTELTDLPFIRDSVLACTQKSGAERVLAGLALVQSPEAAPLMLELKLSSKAPQTASEWLAEDPARTTAGLAQLAATRSKLGDAAKQVLRELSRSGHAETVELVLGEHHAADRIRRSVTEQTEPATVAFNKDTTPEWLLQATVEQLGGRPGRPPRWLTLEHLPLLPLGKHHLDLTQVHAVVNALRESTLQRRMPLVELLQDRIDPAVRDAFAWALFEKWLAGGAPSEGKWALLAVGLWGGDTSVVKLAPMIRAWPGQKQMRRAELGLECLRAIGSETALLELSGIAQKVRFRKLQQMASGFMIQIAGERRLSTAQLDDRIVPHLGLDARGMRLFDYGPRNFRLVLNQQLKPKLCDDAGKVWADLPKPGVSDDPVKSAEALANWKTFKKQVREVLKVQQTRLESAMLSVRRWSVAEFATWIVKHPLMGLLAQGLLWGGLDGGNRLKKTFRVTEDRGIVDRHEAPCSLEDVAGVIIVHPLHLSDEERRAWTEVFADHEIISPFPQLTRRTYSLLPDEAAQTVLRRFDGKRIIAATMLGILERTGWDRGRPTTSGHRPGMLTTCHLKYFPLVELTAVLRSQDGVPAHGFDPSWPEQTLRGCFFVPQDVEPPGGFRTEQAVPLGGVDKVVMSEVLATLEALASRAG